MRFYDNPAPQNPLAESESLLSYRGMGDAPIPLPILIVTDEIRQMVREQVAARLDDRGMEEEARKRGAERDGWFRGLRPILGENQWLTLVPQEVRLLCTQEPVTAATAPTKPSFPPVPQPPRPSRKGWVDARLATAERGLSVEELVALAKTSPIESGFGTDAEEYARWLQSSAQRGRFKKRDGRFISDEMRKRLNGGSDATTTSTGRMDLKAIVKSVLREMGGSGTSGQIIERLWKNRQVLDNLKPTSQYPYSLLSRMAISGELSRKGPIYRLPNTDAPAGFRSAPSQRFNH